MGGFFDNGGYIGRSAVYPNTILNIVKEGLVLYLDAGNADSYPGTGTTWTDLSGNGNHFTLTNAGAYNSAYKYMDFNSQQCYYNTDANFSIGSTTPTYILATRVREDTTSWRTLTRGKVNSSFVDHHVIVETGGLALGMFNNSTSTFYSSGYNQSSLPNYGTSDWVILYFRWSSSSGGYEMSYNDTPSTIRADLSGNSLTAHNGYFHTLGGYNYTAQYWGDIGFFMVYNRALSDTELSINFNALRGRFGI